MKFLCAGAELAEAGSRGFDLDGTRLFAVRRGWRTGSGCCSGRESGLAAIPARRRGAGSG